MNREEAISMVKGTIERLSFIAGGGLYPEERIELLEAFAALRGPQPDPTTGRGQAGDNHWCSHCWDFAQTGVKYVVAVEDNRGMQYPTKKDIPYNYCPSCGRKLEG